MRRAGRRDDQRPVELARLRVGPLRALRAVHQAVGGALAAEGPAGDRGLGDEAQPPALPHRDGAARARLRARVAGQAEAAARWVGHIGQV